MHTHIRHTLFIYVFWSRESTAHNSWSHTPLLEEGWSDWRVWFILALQVGNLPTRDVCAFSDSRMKPIFQHPISSEQPTTLHGSHTHTSAPLQFSFIINETPHLVDNEGRLLRGGNTKSRLCVPQAHTLLCVPCLQLPGVTGGCW